MNQNELEILLKDLLSLGRECEYVEFKVNNKDPREIGEYISALSNSSCLLNERKGYLVFGVEDSCLHLVGTDFNPTTFKIGNEELENWLATLLEPRIDFKIQELCYLENNFVIFEIDATLNTPVSFKGEAYIRVGSYKKKLKDHPEKERKIWNKQHSHSFERKSAYFLDDSAQILKFIDYKAYFKLINQPIPSTQVGIIEKLLQEKFIKRESDGYSISNLGAILLARKLDNFDSLFRKSIRVIIYRGKDRTLTIREQEGHKGYAVGFEGLIKWIDEHLPFNEEIGKALRKNVKVYPILAIRELVANAIIHQDLNFTGTSPLIEIFDDRIEITNPGVPIIPAMRFIDHIPQSRNELLANTMRRMNICEERGSGFDKIIAQCELYQLPAPEIIVGPNYTRVILFAPKTLREMDKPDKIRACYQHCVLKYVSGNQMTNESLRRRFGIEDHNYSTASRIIADTINSSFIKTLDPENKSKKMAKYIPIWA